ncbi:hypothetical protein J5N97_007923 [Dioscorea zingiberensis]|uniref:Thiol-disulfide oxudoreductase DCC n=1 Tax=Dioscorea zingiberensis TaxID=325984 RepID=A0A9D5HW73_9LILI|nr:hypothetical protein J5N97_007923 [Dioscorea zingiberensis]
MASWVALRRLPLLPLFRASSSSTTPAFGIPCPARHSPRAFRFQVCSVHSETKVEPLIKSKDDGSSSETWKVKMLYDGECPLCMREVNMLKERNRAYGAIKFVDISSIDYSPKENQGLDYETVMGRIHAILSDGTVVRDVEAFRRLYEEVGLGWVYAITKYEPIQTIASAIYSIWAKYRLQITGRPSLEEVLKLRKEKLGESCADNKTCKM